VEASGSTGPLTSGVSDF